MAVTNLPGRTPLGAFYRSPLGNLTRPTWEYEVYKHGLIFFTTKKWSEQGLSTAQWNTLVETYRKYNKRGSHYTIVCPSFDPSELYPADGDHLPTKHITFLTATDDPANVEMDLTGWVIYSGDPNDPYNADDVYWLVSVEDYPAIFTEYQGLITDAIDRCNPPLEEQFWIIYSNYSPGSHGVFHRYGLYRYFRYVAGWGVSDFPYGPSWLYGYYSNDPCFLTVINNLLAAYTIP